MQKIAILLTSHNRKEKTLKCLTSLYDAIQQVNEYNFDIYLVDDGSTDGTYESVKTRFPSANIIKGNGNLFWAGGMRLAWETALKENKYDAFLLLNDDVLLTESCLINLLVAHHHSLKVKGEAGIYVGSTVDGKNQNITYGGHLITKNGFILRTRKVIPTNYPQICHLANANILWVSRECVNQIGIFEKFYTHGIADYDYTYNAFKHDIPLWIAPGVCGICMNDHGYNWQKQSVTLKERIRYLKSPKGLAYKEYLYYIRKNFPLFFPYSFTMLWVKTIFPIFWEKLK